MAAFLSLYILWTEVQAAESPFIALGETPSPSAPTASDPSNKGYASLTVEALRNGNRYRERGRSGVMNLSGPGATSSALLLPD